MHISLKLYKVFFISLFFTIGNIYAKDIITFVEYGVTVHTGGHIPLWQVSNQYGLSSIKNNTYIRGGAFYDKTFNTWKLETGLDLAFAAGFTSTFIIQQAYVDLRYKWIGLWAGSKEIDAELLNQRLSSGGLAWSGNARPIPQICIGFLDYVNLTPGIQVKAQISYGWFTDGKYQKKHAGENFPYIKKTKFHHKSIYDVAGQKNIGCSMLVYV